MRKSRQRTLLGATVCGVLAMALAVQWWSLAAGQRPPQGEMTVAASAGDGGHASVPDYPAPGRERFASVVERTLFNPERRPGPPGTAGPASGNARATDPEDLRLEAIVFRGERRAALLRPGRQGQPEWVRQHDTFRGWRIDAIHRDRVRMSSGDRAVDLALRPFGSAEGQGSDDGAANDE